MSKIILKITRPPYIAVNQEWRFESEEGVTFYRTPTPDEEQAMGDSEKMYATYTHEKFSSRTVGPDF